MIKKIIKTYYKLLDEKLENGTMIVLLIAILIISASILTKNTNTHYLVKTSILENNITNKNIVTINGVKYKLILEKIKNRNDF
ncbi:hypothetical protein LRZ95_00710 [Candidatus Gracilibacteria bacterium]|nr:hypothetical protein [Candidatus Gracilibacteria bacterium]